MHAGLLAEELGFDERRRDVVITATLLRTVGYLALPTRPWLCVDPLTADARSLIELHPRLGFNVLMQAPALHDVATVVLYHHERFDGTGYPAGLSGQDIPLAARVLAVLEAYGAMTHERPYREPCSPEPACRALIDAAGTQFDPEVAELFVEQIRRAPRLVRDDVSEAVLDAMPLEPATSSRRRSTAPRCWATTIGSSRMPPRQPSTTHPSASWFSSSPTCLVSTRSWVMSQATS